MSNKKHAEGYWGRYAILGIAVRVELMQTMRHTQAIRVGKYLRYLRRVRDTTQEELAERLGVSVGWVSRIERGVKLPNLPFLFKVGKVLHVPVNELLPGERRRK